MISHTYEQMTRN